MSRSGYTDECDGWDLIRWRGAVKSAIRGKRGQEFLRETLAALDAMPEKKLAKEVLVAGGEVCAMGATAQARGLDMSGVDEYDREAVARRLGISEALAAEIAYENDEGRWNETPEQRWNRMRDWVQSLISVTP
jgi:hypothetical protein